MRKFAPVLLAVMTAACTNPRTEVVVQISVRDLVVPRDLDGLRLVVTDRSLPDGAAEQFASALLPLCPQETTSANCYNFPITLTLVPGPRRPNDLVRVEVQALLASQIVIDDAATFSFRTGTSERLDFILYSDCLGSTCATDDLACDATGHCSKIATAPLKAAPDLGAFDLASSVDLAGADFAGVDFAVEPNPDLAGIDLAGADLRPSLDLRPALDLAPVERGCGSLFVALTAQKQFASAPPIAAYTVTGSFTLEAWVYPYDFAPANQLIAGRGDDLASSTASYGLWVDMTGKPSFRMSDGSNIYTAASAASLSPNVWAHLAGIWDQPSHTVRLWVNGTLATSMPAPTTPPIARTTTPFTVGNVDNSTNAQFHGNIDEVRLSSGTIYSSAFRPEKRFGSTPTSDLALFHFDEAAGNVAVDSSPFANAASLTNASFDTRCQYYRCNMIGLWGGNVAVPANSALEPAGSFTLEAFVMPNDLSATGAADSSNINIIDRASGTTGPFSYHMFIQTSSKLPGFEVSCDGTSWHTAYSNTALPLNLWSHLAGVLDVGAQQVFLYQNGIFVGQSAQFSNCTKASDTSSLLLFVASNFHGFGRFMGWVDEVRLSSKIEYMTNFTVPLSFPSSDGSTLALYHFDELYPSKSAADSAPAGNTATVSPSLADFENRCY